MLYVVHVMVGMETAAEIMLREYLDQAYYTEVFVPKSVSMRRYGGKWHDVLRTLFPGYIFINSIVPDKIFAQMMMIPKGMQVIHADTEILSVYPEEEKFIRSLMDEKYIVQMSAGFLIGEELCITKGVLKNYKGRIKKLDRHKRTAVLAVNLFGRETPVEVGLEVVKKISRAEFWKWKEEEHRKTGRKHHLGTQEEKSGKRDAGKSREEMEIVLIRSGIFSGLEGKILSKNGEKVEVAIYMMGQRMQIELERDEVEELAAGW